MTALSVVHAWAPGLAQSRGGGPPAPATARTGPLTGVGAEGLPAPVADMREAILEAVRTGRLDDLRHAVELNEVKPMIGDGAAGDPIAALAQLSQNGGRDVLEALGRLLDGGWVAVPGGRDIENNRIYVWPRLAEAGAGALDSGPESELARLVAPADLERMRASGRYDGWRLGIGADGTWHWLRR